MKNSETRSQRKRRINQEKLLPKLTRKEELLKKQLSYQRRFGPPTPRNIWHLIIVHQSDEGIVSYCLSGSAESKSKAAKLRREVRIHNYFEYGWFGSYSWDDDHRICVRKQNPGEGMLKFIHRFELELFGEIRTTNPRKIQRN